MTRLASAAQCALFDLSPVTGPGCVHTAAAAPNLTDYDVLLVSLSGGKDSQLAAMVMAERARAAGVLDRVVAVHALLPGDEWPDADRYARLHAAAVGIPRFENVQRTIPAPSAEDPHARQAQDIVEYAELRGRWPDASRRWCTSDFKTTQIRALMTRLVREIDPKRLGRPVRILNVMGMRAQESTRRAKAEDYRHNAAASNGRRHVDDYLPVHGVRLGELHAALDASGIAHHPAYDGDNGEPWAGMSRLSCMFCVLASRDDLVLAAPPARAGRATRRRRGAHGPRLPPQAAHGPGSSSWPPSGSAPTPGPGSSASPRRSAPYVSK